ncbi:MAG: adenosylcobinamide-phosphate synthase CbiB [Rickettsiales bacterium]
MSLLETAPVLLLALIIDAVVGDPAWIYRRVPHPVVLMGSVIGWLDRAWNRETHAPATRRCLGISAILVTLALAAIAGLAMGVVLDAMPQAEVFEAVLASTMLAQNSLYRHVADVERGFGAGGLESAHEAVRLIVGRDPASLDAQGTCRAAIESLAENFSDGVVAPAFWFLLFGLPGLLAYKALNTADSMIGHRNDRYRMFGWATARLDDLANLVPARLSALLLALGAGLGSGGSPRAAVTAAFRDARHHRSVNAGWPEAAMAGGLGLKLAGPRSYQGELVEDAWMGDGREAAEPHNIRRALGLYLRACAILMAIVALTVVAQI